MKYIRTAAFIIVLAACIYSMFAVRDRLSDKFSAWRHVRKQIKPGEFQNTGASALGLIEFLATGAKPLIADMYWIKATTFNADEVFEMAKQRAAEGKSIGSVLSLEADVPLTPEDKRDLYNLIRNATYLDPKFEYAYYFGGNMLAWNGELTLASVLLEKGLRKNLRSGMLASSLSFIYYYFYRDWNKGAYYARMSYKYSGKYSSTPKGVADLYAAGRHYDLAVTFLADAMESVKDPDTRKQMEEQMNYLFVEKYIEYLEKALRRYRDATGVYPPTLETLVKAGIVKAVPKDPFGGKFIIAGPGKVENKPYNRSDHFEKMRKHLQETPSAGRDLVK